MLSRVASFFRSAVRRARFEQEMDAELRGHMRAYAESLIEQGASSGEAYARARREFGALEGVKDECRESKGLGWLDALARDFRFSARTLRKSPTFALASIVTLALCIGANTAIFSVVDTMLFRPLPFPGPEKLAWVSTHFHTPEGEFEFTPQDGRRWEFLRDHSRTLDLAAYSAGSTGVNLAPSGAGAQYVKQQRVSAGFFRVLGVSPVIGREILPEEDRPGGPAVVLLSHELWSRAFGADRSIVGRKILLRGEPYTVIGVMPPRFNSLPPAELWTPLRPTTVGEGSGGNYSVLGRFRGSVRFQDANAEMNSLGAAYFSQRHFRSGVSGTLHLISVRRALADSVRTPLLLLWAAVGLVLLIGCVNVASLALARANSRRHEVGTRLALGSGRGAIFRQFIAESLLVAASGGVLGVAIGFLTLQSSRKALAVIGWTQPFSIDLRVTAAMGAAALLTALLFGLYPAVETARLDVRAALASSGRTASLHRSMWVRDALVVSEVALGMVLLIAAGLVLRTLAHLTGVNPGFEPGHVLTASLSLQDARYATSTNVNRLFDESLERLRRYPGIEAAGVGLTAPYERPLNEGMRVLDGPHPMSEPTAVNVTYVTPGYFEALRIRLLRGRAFDRRDVQGGQGVAIVNDAFQRRFLRDSEPLGRRLAFGNDSVEVVGVAADVPAQNGIGGDYGPVDAIPGVYVPASQFGGGFRMAHAWFDPKWVVRATGTRAEISRAIEQAIAAEDAQLPIAEFRGMDEVRSNAFGLQRLETVLLASLAALALLLAAVGVYGLIAHLVAERTRELGIRLALGCSRTRAIAGATRSGIALAAGGVAAGAALAWWAGRLIRSLLWGVEATDRLTFTAVGSILLAVAALASLAPALRIVRINPAVTLREE